MRCVSPPAALLCTVTNIRATFIKLILQLQGLLYIRQQRVTARVRGHGQSTTSPGKGQIREASGRTLGHLAGRKNQSQLGIALGKSGNPLEEGNIDPTGRDLWSLRRRVASAAGNRVPNVLPGCCLLPRPPLDTHTLQPSSCFRSGASGQLPTDQVPFFSSLHQRAN